jgi:hypothetical protein
MPVIRKALVAIALLASGCASPSPTADPRADQMAKGFPQPQPGKGALYVYRSGLMGFARPIDVQIVGGAIASLPHNGYIRLEGPPGPIEIDCKVGDKTNAGQVEIGEGRTRFVEVSMKVTALMPGCEVAEVPPEQGRHAVLSGQRVDVQ